MPWLTKHRCVLILVLAVFAVYFQTSGFPWIHLDDYKHIFENPLMLNPSFSNFFEFWKAPFFTLYIPFTYTIWYGLAQITPSAWLFHLANVSFHLGSSIFVFRLLMELLDTEAPALIGALIFALHPIQIEAVTWISGLKDCLFSFLVLGTLYLYTLKLKKKSKLPEWLFYGLTLLAALSKPTAVILPLFFLVWRRFYLKENWASSFKGIAVHLMIVLPIALITKEVQPNFQVKDLAPLWFRPLVAFHALGFYLKQVLVPIGFCLDYGRNPTWLMKHSWEEVYLPVISLIGLGLIYQFRKQHALVLTSLLIIIPLVPTSGIVPFQFQLFSTVADRYFYLSMFGVAFGVAYFLKIQRRRLFQHQGIGYVVLLALFSFQHLTHWKSNESIFKYTIARNPNSFLARNNLAYDLFDHQRFAEAADQLKHVTRLRPEEPELFMNYTSALVRSGQTAEAVQVLKDLLKRKPDHAQAQRLLIQLDPKG